MKCHECETTGQRSKVHIGGATMTAMADFQYYDEDGIYHHHNPNYTDNHYSCSNGHSWVERYQTTCPAGDFGGKV